MEDKKCNIVLDLLPLYVDEVCSEDTKQYIEEHMKACEVCKKEYEEMKKELVLPVDDDSGMIKKIKRRNRIEKGIIAGVAAITLAIVCCILICFALAPRTNVSGDVLNQVSVEQDAKGLWWLTKRGNAVDVSRVGVRIYKEDGTILADTVNGKVNGNFSEEKNVEIELVFCGSLFSKIGHRLYDQSAVEGGMEEKNVILGESWKDRVRAIYYMDGDKRIDLWK